MPLSPHEGSRSSLSLRTAKARVKVEDVDNLFAEEEKLLEDDTKYRSDPMSLKVIGLHIIVSKPEVFLCKDLFSQAMRLCTLERGLLACLGLPGHYKEGHREDSSEGLGQASQNLQEEGQLGLPHFALQEGGKDWDANDESIVWKPDLSEVLAFNIHTNWEVAKPGRDFFMASYIADSCYAYLDFNHPIFPPWLHPSNAPIHVLFGALYVYKYRGYIAPICSHFYPPIYKFIIEADMPRMVAAVRLDLELIKALWYFKKSTIIRVEGTLTPPTELPPYVPDRLAALEVARQCNYGVARRCKVKNQKPYPYLPFKIGDVYFSNWLALEKVVRETKTMNLTTAGVTRCWETYGKVEENLKPIRDKEEVESKIRLEVELEETDEALKKKLLRGLLTGLPKVQLPPTSTTATSSSLISPIVTIASPGFATSSSIGPSTAIPPSMDTPFSFKIPSLGSVFSPVTSSPATVSPTILVSSIPSSSNVSSPELSIIPPSTPSSHDTLLTPEESTDVSSKSLSFFPCHLTVPFIHHHYFKKGRATGNECHPSIRLATFDSSTSLSVPTPAFTAPIEYRLSTLLIASEASIVLGFSKDISSPEDSTKAPSLSSSYPFSITGESIMASLATSSTPSQPGAATSPNPLAQAVNKQQWIHMTRKRGAKSIGMDDRELMVDPVSIVRSTNKMSKEAVERIQMELSQAHDKIVISPSMDTEI
eukprot:Gb_40117 [translate_table: standard]